MELLFKGLESVKKKYVGLEMMQGKKVNRNGIYCTRCPGFPEFRNHLLNFLAELIYIVFQKVSPEELYNGVHF